MQVRSADFKTAAAQKLGDEQLYRALTGLRTRMVGGRAIAIQELDNFEEIREAARAVRDFTLANLDHFLELFERNALASGAHVHWAETGEDVNRIVLDIARETGVRKIIKSKSMLGEESALNEFLEAGGIEVRVGDAAPGVIRKSELSRDRSEQRPDRFAAGEKVDAKIMQIDHAARKVQLSIKARELDEEKQAVAAYGSSDSGASLGDILGAAMKEKRESAERAEALDRAVSELGQPAEPEKP